MQGYVNQSPVKQVWLPLDIKWLKECLNIAGKPFKNFAIEYKEAFGIDLHDLFELGYNEENDYYFVRVKTRACIGGYNPGSLEENELYAQGFALNNVIIELNANAQSTNPRNLLGILLGEREVYGFGFNFVLPVETTPVDSIDDLTIQINEI